MSTLDRLSDQIAASFESTIAVRRAEAKSMFRRSLMTDDAAAKFWCDFEDWATTLRGVMTATFRASDDAEPRAYALESALFDVEERLRDARRPRPPGGRPTRCGC